MTTSPQIDRLHVPLMTDIQTPGGLNTVVRNLAAAQTGLGLSSHILDCLGTARSKRPEIYDLSAEPASPIRLDVIEYHFAQTSSRFRPILPSPKTEIFHFHGPWAAESRSAGDSHIRVFVKRAVERRVYRKFSVFTTHSEAFKNILSSDYGVSRSLISVVDLAVDCEEFTPGDRSLARTGLGLPPDRFIVGTLRRLVPRMGISTAIEAMRHRPDELLAIAGDGPDRIRLEALVKENHLEDRVRFLGKLTHDEVVEFYRALDVMLVPSTGLEGFGLVVLEAMACGTPVIASDCGGLPAALGKWADEFTFEAGNTRDLNAVLDRVMAHLPSRADMRGYAETKSWTRTAIAIEQIISNSR